MAAKTADDAPDTQKKHDHNAPRQAVLRLIHLLRIEKQGLYVVLVYAMGIGVASLAAPIGVQMLVSAIAFGGLAQPVVILSLLVLMALTFAAVLRAAQAWVVERIQQRLFVRVATDLAERLPRLSTSTLDDKYHTPELVNRFFDVLTLQKGAAMLLLDGVFVTLQMIVGGILLALYHPALIAFAAVIFVAIVVILYGLGRRGSATSIEESKVKYALVAWFEEVARHPILFRSRGGGSLAVARSNVLIHEYVEARRAHYRILFRQTAAFLGVQAIATAALLALGGLLVLRGQLTLGQLVAAELILTAVVAGFAKFGKYLEIYYDLVAAMDKLGKLVSLPLERGDAGDAADSSRKANNDSTGTFDSAAESAPAPHAAPHAAPLAVRVVDAEYQHEKRGSSSSAEGAGLTRLSLDVPAGSRVAIVGPNGSGKSTLIDLFFGLREPVRGYIEMDRLPLREMSLRELRTKVALVRGAEIFDGSVMENVCMCRKDITLEDVRTALEAVGLWEEIANLPDGLATHITTSGGNISAGQAQRLALARALISRPKLLLLDEALDHLDPKARATVLRCVLGREAPWTVIVATHDPAVAQACSRQYVLDRGALSSSAPSAPSVPSPHSPAEKEGTLSS